MGCRTKAVRFVSALDSTPELSELRKTIIKERYVPLLETYERRCFRLAYSYHIARLLVTVGSLVVPALLSIQYTNTGTTTTSYSDPDSFSYRIYWATWVLSLLVTTSNGIVSVFKLDKKYYFIHTTYEQLRSEGWQYLGLSGRYGGSLTIGQVPSHENQFIYFCHMIEKIKMRQVEEEYYKMNDTNTVSQGPAKTNGNGNTDLKTVATAQSLENLIPLTPLKSTLDQIHPDLMKQLLSMGFKSKEKVDDGISSQEKKNDRPVSVSIDLSGNTFD